jgi:aldehyde dehydrogenase (NAD+)
VDYIAAEEKIYKKLIKYIVKYSKSIMKIKNLQDNYAKIINKKHFDRLMELINQSNILYSGGHDEEKLFIYPTIVEATPSDAIMEDEIFGPVLPILKFKNYEEIKSFIKSKPKPLAMYIFTENKTYKETILNDIQSGGVTINDTLIHLSSNHLPFGGVGESGMGSYHGFYSFEEFSQKRAIIDRSTVVDIPLRYPPYNQGKLEIVKKVF